MEPPHGGFKIETRNRYLDPEVAQNIISVGTSRKEAMVNVVVFRGQQDTRRGNAVAAAQNYCCAAVQ
jgi:hypothetical protein